jgi:hypothetical protein
MKRRGSTVFRLILSTLAIGLVVGLCWCVPAMGQTAVKQRAVVTTTDYTTTAVTVIGVDAPRASQTDRAPLASDEHVATYGNFFYRIGRYNNDWVAKFHVSDPDTPIYQYSVLATPGGASRNPHDLVFVNENKAYLLFYGGDTIWIVNPSAVRQADFKIGEIAIDGAYDDGDGIPEVHAGLVHDGKLYVIMQQLDRNTAWWDPAGPGYLAVYDVATGQEIDTGGGSPKGINLGIHNPQTIEYMAANDLIYISGVGNYVINDATFQSGIVSVDPDTYAVTNIVSDDGGFTGAGTISTMRTALADNSYYIAGGWYTGYNLYYFNTADGVSGGTVAALDGKSMSGDYGALGLDKNGLVWVLNTDDNRVELVDPSANTVEATVSTGTLAPSCLAFCPHDATDTDGDGVPDFEDDYPADDTRAAFQSAGGRGKVVIETDSGALGEVEAMSDEAESVDQTGKPTDVEFPYGLWSFSITGLSVWQAVTVTLTFPEALADGAKFYKNDGTGFEVFTNAVFAGDTVTLTLQDGGDGDGDGLANGTIVDPGGVAVSTSGGSGGSGGGGGGGCFIDTAF